MRLLSITLRGFGSYRDETHVDLEGLSFTGVVGPNYSGKSTLIFDAVAFALFGWTRAELVMTDVITEGERSCDVSVAFALGDEAYRVRRTYARNGRTECHLWRQETTSPSGWEPLTEKTGEATAAITDILGMDSSTAMATWMVEQNRFDSLCSAKPAERRAILGRALGLERYTDLRRAADERRLGAATAAEKAESSIGAIDAALADLDAADAATGDLASFTDDELTAHDAALADKIADLTRSLQGARPIDETRAAARDARAAADEQRSAEEERRAAAARDAERAAQGARRAEQAAARAARAATTARERAQERLDEIDTAGAAVADARARMEQAGAAVASRQDEADSLADDAAAQAARIAALEADKASLLESMARERKRADQIAVTLDEGHGECFTCHQELSPGAAGELAAEQRRVLEDISTRGKAVDAHLEQAASTARRIAAQRATAARVLSEARDALRTAERRVEGIERMLASQDEARDALEAAIGAEEAALREADQAARAARAIAEEGAAAIAELEGDSARLISLEAAAAKAEKELADALAASEGGSADSMRLRREAAEDERRVLWGEIARRKAAAEQRESMRLRREAAVADLDSSRAQEAQWEVLRQAFSPMGIPARILNAVVAEINEETNASLAGMGVGFGVDITTLRQGARRGVAPREEVGFTVVTPDGTRKFSSLSGAEKFMTALAVRLALSRCLARRTGTPILSLILDEGWGNLDGDNRAAAMRMLHGLSKELAIYAVTHVDDVRDGFDSLIEVSRDCGTSAVEVSRTS